MSTSGERKPCDCTHWKFLIEHDVPSVHGCITLADGPTVELHFLHPTPPSPTENDDSEERDAELVMVGLEAAKGN
ncbi:MAG: hypothetical protein ACREIA_06535, partial [Opitutaceae bacterium]